jgi:O-antigen/teichoic acid export membrane protein
MSVIVKNITSSWASILVGIAMAFVLAPLTVRSLGDQYYGIWTLLMQLTGYLWLFDFGVRESVVKYVAQYHANDDHEQVNSTVNAAVSIYSLVSLATLALSALLALALPYAFNIPAGAETTARLTALLVGATVAQYFVFNVFIGIVGGLQKFYVLARLGMIFTIVRGVLTYILLTIGYGIVTLALLQFSLALVQNLFTYRVSRSMLPYLVLQPAWPKREEAVRLLNYGKYVLISNIGDKIVFATDSVIVGMFLPISSLTFYAIGGSLIEQFRSFVMSMASVVNPLSSSLEARKEARTLVLVVTTGARAATLLGLPICIGFFTLGKQFIGLWMGAEYAEPAGQILIVLAIGHLIGLPYYTISGVLYGLGRHHIVAYTRIFEGLVNLVLSIVLVQKYGLVGVAVGTVIPHIIVVAGVLPAVLARWVPIDLREYYLSTYLRPLVASLPFWGTCWLIATEVRPDGFLVFFASVGLALVTYIVPCWFIVLSGEERATLTAALRQRLLARRPVEGVS